jgi:hypothetical protein
VEAGDGVVAVVFAAEERRQLQPADRGLQLVQGPSEIALDLPVRALVEELVEDLGLLELLGQRVEALDLLSDPGQAGGQLLAAGGVVPEVGTGELLLEVVPFRPAGLDVKGTPSRSPACRPGPSPAPRSRS